MIRRFLLVSVCLFILITASIVTACLIGSVQTSPPVAAIFTNPDGSACELPCLFGVNAHQARQAVALLVQHPLTRDLSASTTDCAKSSAFLSDPNLVLYIRCAQSSTI